MTVRLGRVLNRGDDAKGIDVLSREVMERQGEVEERDGGEDKDEDDGGIPLRHRAALRKKVYSYAERKRYVYCRTPTPPPTTTVTLTVGETGIRCKMGRPGARKPLRDGAVCST